jgi:hypothetical protein
VKPSGLSNEALGDVLTAGLTAIGIDPQATAVYLRADGVERQQLLVATPLGLVAADRQMLVNDPHNRARLFMRLVPWDKLSDLTMETESIRDPNLSPPAYVTTVTLTLPGLDGGSDALLKGSDDRLRAEPGNGFMVFAAACIQAVFGTETVEYVVESEGNDADE